MELQQREFIWCFNQNPENLNPPSSNTGVLGNLHGVEIGVRPDWLGVSFHQRFFPSNIEAFGFRLFKRFVKSILNGHSVGWRLDLTARGHNGFLYAIKLMFGREERASIQWGGESQRKRVMLELRGGICSLLQERDWISLNRLVISSGGRISRFDIAADDKNGLAFDVFKIRDDHEENPRSFSSVYKVGNGGRLPKTLWIEGRGEGEGATFNIGKRTGQLMHCVYQKGIQLADTVEGKAHPRWVRWEVRFKRSNSITIDPVIMLPTSWVPAFIGSCNYVMQKTDEIGARFTHPEVDPLHEPQEASARAIKACSEQWGGFLREVGKVIGWDRLRRELERPCSNLIFCDLTCYDADGILSKLASLRDGGPASGSGALVASSSSDVLEW
jgi:hypothetical protein